MAFQDDPLAGYTSDWRKRQQATTAAPPEPDPLGGYTPDWRERMAAPSGPRADPAPFAAVDPFARGLALEAPIPTDAISARLRPQPEFGVGDVRAAPAPAPPAPIYDPVAERIATPGIPGMATITPTESARLTSIKPRERGYDPITMGATGLAHGTLGLGEVVGTGLQYAAAKIDRPRELDPFGIPIEPGAPPAQPQPTPLTEGLRATGRQVEQFWSEKAKRFELPSDLQGAIVDNPALMLDPAWLAYGVGDMAPSFAAAMVPGAAGQRFLAIAGRSLPYTPETIARLARIGGAVAGGSVGGSLEGAGTYREILELTGDEQKAAAAAEAMALASAGLNALSVGRALKPESWSSFMRYLGTGAWEAVTEYGEEPAEVAIKMAATPEFTPEMAGEQLKQGLNVAVPAFITGAGGAAFTGTRDTPPPAPDPEQRRAESTRLYAEIGGVLDREPQLTDEQVAAMIAPNAPAGTDPLPMVRAARAARAPVMPEPVAPAAVAQPTPAPAPAPAAERVDTELPSPATPAAAAPPAPLDPRAPNVAPDMQLGSESASNPRTPPAVAREFRRAGKNGESRLVITRNTKPGEKPFRTTVLHADGTPLVHFTDYTYDEAVERARAMGAVEVGERGTPPPPTPTPLERAKADAARPAPVAPETVTTPVTAETAEVELWQLSHDEAMQAGFDVWARELARSDNPTLRGQARAWLDAYRGRYDSEPAKEAFRASDISHAEMSSRAYRTAVRKAADRGELVPDDVRNEAVPAPRRTPQVEALPGTAPLGMPAPAAAVPAPAPAPAPPPASQTVTPVTDRQQVALPRELAGAKPTYGLGGGVVRRLQFESDVDKALYIVAQDKKSKRDADYMGWLRERFPEADDREIRRLGSNVKQQVRNLARQGGTTGEDVVVVGAQRHAPRARIETPAPLEGRGERTRSVRIETGSVTPTRAGVEPMHLATEFEEEYADGSSVTRAADGTVTRDSRPATPGAAAAEGQAEPNDRETQVRNMVSNRTLESLVEERTRKRREKDKYAANAVPAQLEASLKMLSEAIRRKQAQAAPTPTAPSVDTQVSVSPPAPAPAPAPAPIAESEFGAKNTVFTADAAEAARALLRKKFLRPNVVTVFDPELAQAGLSLTGFYVEGGVRKFIDVSQRVANDIGVTLKELRPHLRGWYQHVRTQLEDLGQDISGMDDDAAIRDALSDIDALPEEGTGEPAANTPALADDGRANTEGESPGAVPEPRAERPARKPSRPDRGEGEAELPEAGAGVPGDGAPAVGVRPDGGAGDGAEGRPGPDGLDADNTPATKPALIKGEDFKLTPEAITDLGGPKQRARQNIAAIRIVRDIAATGRAATREEQVALAKFVGWGGLKDMFPKFGVWKPEWDALGNELKDLLTPEEYATAERSTQYAHYTTPEVIGAIYDALRHMGVRGNVAALEPGAGIGHFVGLSPIAARFTAVEMDQLSADILTALYPHQTVHAKPYQDVVLPDGSQDVVVGNPPFADIGVFDRKYPVKLKLHDYFFVKSLDKLRSGGILAFVSSTGAMDKANDAARDMMAARADFLGAVRLPGGAFMKTAATKVTTDILFFQKRAPGVAAEHRAPWHDLKTVEAAGGETFKINEYFVDHPGQVLGTIVADDLHPDRAGVAPIVGQDLAAEIKKALGVLPADIYVARDPAQDEPVAQLGGVPEGARQGQYVLKGGRVTQVQGDRLVALPIDPRSADGQRIAALVRLGEAARHVLDLNTTDATDADLAVGQKAMGRAYDAFVKEYGQITQVTANKKGALVRKVLRGYNDPVNGPLVAALESTTPQGKIEKGPLFTERVAHGLTAPTNLDTAWKAVVASLIRFGRVDMPYITEQYGKPEAEVVAEIEGKLFTNPLTGLWETAETYLSGNVREKLATAKEYAQNDQRFEVNVQALEKAQPEDVTVNQMRRMRATSLGVTWIQPATYRAFARSLGLDLEIEYREMDGKYRVARAGRDAVLNAAKLKQWSTSRVDLAELMRDALNGKPTEVFDRDSSGNEHLNKKETELAQKLRAKLQARFDQMIFDDSPATLERAHRRFNDVMNHTVLAKWDGSHLAEADGTPRFPGIARLFRGNPLRLAPHQLNVVWRFLASGNVLLAHEVGAGKTIEMVVMGMEARRMGLAKKPIYVVPNNMLEQFRNEFLEIYPNAKLIVADPENFHTDRRRAFLGRVAAGDWDGVILTHASLKLIPNSPETTARITRQWLAEFRDALERAEAAGETEFTVARIQQAIERFENTLAALMDKKRSDQTVYFEELGTDLMFVDEAHEYKNLPLASAGVVQQTEAQKTVDLYIKTRHIEHVNPGRGLVFATATPVSNRIAEIYVMQKYLGEGLLKKHGYASPDAWARDFIESWVEDEQTAIGTIEPKERPRGYRQAFAMSLLFRQLADVKTAKDLNLPIPKLIGGTGEDVLIPGSSRLREFVRSLKTRWDSRPRKPAKGDDSVFPIMNDGRFGSVAAELVTSSHAAAQGHDSSTPWEHSKASYAADRAAKIYHETTAVRGTQVIFSDLGVPKNLRQTDQEELRAMLKEENPDMTDAEITAEVEEIEGKADYDIYNDIKRRLVKQGVPAAEIAFIQEVPKRRRQELIDKIKSGEIRILIGSTPTMGQGTNMQDRLVALHHIDVPYKPAWLHQREGRILRRGNTLYDTGAIEGVRILRYILKGSFDQKSWQVIENKARFVEQGMTADASAGLVTEAAGVTLSAAEFAAELKSQASDNPFALPYALARRAYESLKLEQEGHSDLEFRNRQEVKYREEWLAREEKSLPEAQANAGLVQDVTGDKFQVTVGGDVISDRKAANAKLNELVGAARVMSREGGPRWVGEFAGLRLGITRQWGTLRWVVGVRRNDLQYEQDVAELGGDQVDKLARLPNQVRSLPERTSNNIAHIRTQIAEFKEQLGKPFERQAELEAARARADELEAQNRAWHPDHQPEPEPETALDRAERAAAAGAPAPAGFQHTYWLDRIEAEARARVENRIGRLRYSGGPSTEELIDYAIIGAAKIVRGARTVGAWSRGMVDDFGSAIKPHLKQIRKLALKIARNGTQGVRRELAALPDAIRLRAEGAIRAIHTGRTVTPGDVGLTRPRTQLPPAGRTERRLLLERRKRDRLERKRRVLAALADRFGAAQTVDEVMARAQRVIEAALVPAQARDVMALLRAAQSPADARRAVKRAEAILKAQLHAKAVADLREQVRRALKRKIRPEFMKEVVVTAAEVEAKRGFPKGTRKALAATARYLAQHTDTGIADEVRRRLAAASPESLRKMEPDEITQLADAVRAAIHADRTLDRLQGLRKGQLIKDVSAAIVQEVGTLPILAPGEARVGSGWQTLLPLWVPGGKRHEVTHRRGSTGLYVKEWSARPETLMEALSETLRQLGWEDFVDAHDVEQRYLHGLQDDLREAVRKAGELVQRDFVRTKTTLGIVEQAWTKEFEDWRTDTFELDDANGKEVQIARYELWDLLSSLRDPENALILRKGGASLERSGTPLLLDDASIQRLRDLADDGDRAMVDALFRAYNGRMKQIANHGSLGAVGYEIATRPDYYPQDLDLDYKNTDADPMEAFAGEIKASVASWGHYKARSGGVTVLEIHDAMERYLNHARNVSRISAYWTPVNNFKAVMGSVEVKQAIKARVGAPGYDRLVDAVRMQAIPEFDRSEGRRRLRVLVRLYGTGILALRLTTPILNFTGLIVSAAYSPNGFSNLFRTLSALTNAERARINATANKHAPYWRTRYGGNFVHEVMSGLGTARRHTYGHRRTFVEWLFAPIEATDRLTNMMRWHMAELEVQRNSPQLAADRFKSQAGLDAFYEAVAKKWTRLVFRSDNTAAGIELSGILAAGRRDPVTGSFAMMQNAASKLYSLPVRAGFQARQGDHRGAGRSLFAFGVTVATIAVIREVLGRLKGDDDDEMMKSLLLRAANEAASSLPVVGPNVVAPILRRLAGNRGAVYPASAIDEWLIEIGGIANSVHSAFESYAKDELDAKGDKVWSRHLLRASERAVGLVASGALDLFKMEENVRKRIMRTGNDVVLPDEEDDTDLTQERRLLFRAIRDNDPREFRQAIEEIRAKGERADLDEVLAAINRRYGRYTKYEEGKPERKKLNERQLVAVDQGIAERDELRKVARTLARENRDVLSPGGSRPSRPRRPARPERPARP